MIIIKTTPDGTRTYSVTRALIDVAKKLFPENDDTGAVFSLARQFTGDQLATIDRLSECSLERAVHRAAGWISHYKESGEALALAMRKHSVPCRDKLIELERV
jgi:hypothetical protein